MKRFLSSVAGKVVLLLAVSALLLVAVLNLLPAYYVKHSIEVSARSNLLSFSRTTSAFLAENSAQEGGNAHLLDLSADDLRILRISWDGTVVQDSSIYHSVVGNVLLSADFARASAGETTFSMRLDNDCFYFSLMTPDAQMYPSGRCDVIQLTCSDAELAQAYHQMQSNLLMFSLLLLILFTLAAGIYVSHLSAGTKALQTGMQEIRKGNFAYRIPEQGDAEFVEIGRDLNDCCETIAATNEQRRRFVSDASHELKTPLASIKLLSDSIIQTPNMDREEINEFLTDISNEIDRLTRISTRLLSLARYDEDNPVLTEELDIAAVANTVCRMLDPLATAASCVIRREFSDHVMIYANYDNVYQIFYNLVENSIKYSGTGKEVRVFLFERDGLAHFIVDDDGEGIPESDLKKIFDRFYRVDKARSRATGGTGLGLSIVFSAVEACGGTVEASNRPKGGARFVVKFPLLRGVGSENGGELR